MSARRQATADRPGQVSEQQDGGSGARGNQTEQEADRAAAGRAAELTQGTELTQGIELTQGTELTQAAAGDRTAASVPPPELSQASKAGQRKPRGAKAKSKREPGNQAPAGGGTAASFGRARPAGPLPTRVPASQRSPAGPAPGGHLAEAQSGGRLAFESAADPAGTGPPEPPGLSTRLMSLARMIQVGSARGGRDGFSKELLTDAEGVLGRAGERMRLSSGHTVVALAGGTGSGKSSIFNWIAGADFSAVGVTRPVTREAHACIWGATGSGALVDWLGVPARYRYSRASALDRGEADLVGLVLLDLPDHDSVVHHAGDMVDRLITMADVLIWVLDPQKYADAAVHRTFLVPMAGHADVVAVVLNQVDLLDGSQIDDCVADLRRLLDSEDLTEVPILVTSAVTGAGLDDLRTLLVEAVAARVAALVRISADVDVVVARFADYAGDAAAEQRVVPAGSVDEVAARFEHAAGVPAVCDALRSARLLRAADFVGWPVTWLVQRLTGRGALRKMQLGLLWNDLRSVSTGPAGAQQAEIDNALTEFGDSLAAGLPEPWSDTVRSAARSQVDAIPAAVGAAIGDALPEEESVLWWWRLAGAWQGLLLGVAAVAIAWMALITAFGVLHAASGAPALFTDTRPLPWIAACAVVALGLGAATARACLSLVRRNAEQENGTVAAGIKERFAAVASEMVIRPAAQELSEFERFREEVKAAGHGAIFAPAS